MPSLLALVLLRSACATNHSKQLSSLPGAYRHALALHAGNGNYTAYRAELLSICRLREMDQLCREGLPMRAYYYDWWHPGLPFGVSCDRMERLPSSHLDGGHGVPVCNPEERFALDCNVLSVSRWNGDANFEEGIRRRWPHCRITAMAGTTRDAQVGRKPPAGLDVMPNSFDRTSYRQFVGRHFSLLKVDCEGCELEALLPFLDNVPTDQVIVEVHGCHRHYQFAFGMVHGMAHVDRQHGLMTGLASRGYSVFAAEPNILWSDGTCITYSLDGPQQSKIAAACREGRVAECREGRQSLNRPPRPPPPPHPPPPHPPPRPAFLSWLRWQY